MHIRVWNSAWSAMCSQSVSRSEVQSQRARCLRAGVSESVLIPMHPLSSYPPSGWWVRLKLSVPHTRFSATVAGSGRRLVRTGFLWVAAPSAEQTHGLHRTKLCGALVISRGAPHPTGYLEVPPAFSPESSWANWKSSRQRADVRNAGAGLGMGFRRVSV